jgi:hypothetical protein
VFRSASQEAPEINYVRAVPILMEKNSTQTQNSADDAAAGNARNNVTYREVKPVLQGNIWTLRNVTPESGIVRELPAFTAWKTEGAELSEVVTNEEGGVSSNMIVGSKVTPLPNGKYRYDYAIYNMNSDLAVQALSVPVKNLDPSSVGYKGVPMYGEIWSNDPWKTKVETDRVTWSTKPYSEDANANALRWGTTYNFWFVAGAPGVPSSATLVRFKSPPAGQSPNATAPVVAPAP